MSCVDSLSGAQLLALWRELGFQLEPDDIAPVAEPTLVELQRCESCQFEFFDQRLTGRGNFYDRLSQFAAYYSEVRPEFSRTLKWVRSLSVKKILDVGCGAGAFLDEAAAAGLQTSGIELNQAARELARSKGHEVFDCFLQEIDRSTKFDLVTAFQVLEHVSDPVRFLQLMARQVRAGGYLAIAVPNHGGLYRLAPLDPHSWPPHHVTRWTMAHLEQAGSRAGLKLVHKTADILYGAAIKHFSQFDARLSRAVGRPVQLVRHRLLPCFSFVYRKAGMRFWLPSGGGLSISALFEKPVQRAELDANASHSSIL